MGQARRRKAEIDALKDMGPPVDPGSKDPAALIGLARRLHGLFETAREDGDIEPALTFLRRKTEETQGSLGHIEVACRKGCAHCCHAWVSATAPEILSVARLIRERGDAAVQRVSEAHAATGGYGFDDRPEHPYPCPLLADDICSVYDQRPVLCRLKVSMDADACARAVYDDITAGIPSPLKYVSALDMFSRGLAAALKRAGLPHRAYDYTAGLARALEVPDAEKRWLAGEDIFAGIAMDPKDVMHDDWSGRFYTMAFGQ